MDYSYFNAIILESEQTTSLRQYSFCFIYLLQSIKMNTSRVDCNITKMFEER